MDPETLPLPAPRLTGGPALDDVLARRRSCRALGGPALAPGELGQLLWAAQGVSEPAQGLRTAPSAGAAFPLVVHVVAADGVRRYDPATHALRLLTAADRRAELARAAFDQDSVRSAAASFVLVAIVARTRARYGTRAERYVTLEAGHAAQNLLLEATALGLAAVPVGAFDDAAVRAVVGEPPGATPRYIVPVGRSP